MGKMNVGLSYSIEKDPDREDVELAKIISVALGRPLEHLIRESIFKVEQATNLRANWSGLNVRCHKTTQSGQGFCFKSLRHGEGIMPDIILGFTGDVKDFIITLLHELLHLVRYDEQVLDEKALEIYFQSDIGM